MKKQTKKLSLSKKTISNLKFSEMNRFIGGGTSGNYSNLHTCAGGPCRTLKCTQKGNTCAGHNTCYTC